MMKKLHVYLHSNVTCYFFCIGSTIIGPSFIYLMISGAFVTSFQIDNWSSFWYNLIPIVIFLFVCFFFDVRIQVIVQITTVIEIQTVINKYLSLRSYFYSS